MAFVKRAARFKECAMDILIAVHLAKSSPSASQKSSPSASGRLTRLTGEGRSFFTVSRNAVRKKNVLAAWEASLERGGSCAVCNRAVPSLPSSASQRSLPFARKGITNVQLVNGLRPSYKRSVRQPCVRVQSDKCWTKIVMDFNAYMYM